MDNETVPEAIPMRDNSTESQQQKNSNTFESEPAEEELEIPRASVDMDMIPIELISITDGCVLAKKNPV